MKRKGLYVELGGGIRPRPGYINVDTCETADVKWDLEKTPLPFDDNSVDYLYTSNCLEHVRLLYQLLLDVARICRVGATLEIVVPNHLNQDAMCPGHEHVLTPNYFNKLALKTDVKGEFFKKAGKVPVLKSVVHRHNRPALKHARTLFPKMNDDELMKFVPNCCREDYITMRIVELK